MSPVHELGAEVTALRRGRGLPSLSRLTPRGRVVVMCVGIAAIAAALQLGPVRSLGPPYPELVLPWWAMAVGFALAEVFVVHVEFRRGAHTFSLSELPLVLSLFFVDPAGLAAARLVGSGLALVVHRRQSGVKLLFNLSMFALEAGLVSVVFHAVLGSHSASDPQAWGAAFAAMLVATVLSTTTVSLAMLLHEGGLRTRAVAHAVLTGVVLSALTNTSLALVAVVVVMKDRRAVWLLLVVATILFLAYRAYTSLSQRYSRLELLYDFTRVAGRSIEVQAIVLAILGQARELLRAERAEILLCRAAGDDAVAMSLGADDRLETRHVPPPGTGTMRALVLDSGRPLLVPRQSRDAWLQAQLQHEAMKDALIAPLPTEAAIIGTMLVADRLGDVSTFDGEDLKLFATLANHASISIENGRLVERLREEAAQKEYQALHDALTGLPNRALFHQRVEEAITGASATASRSAVMLVDLDRFKEVNDTLGHHNGDLLLRAISGRLQGTLKRSDTIARLGGDEFAILLPEVAGQAEAAHAAERVLRALDEPFGLKDLTLHVNASVGIALYPTHGEDPATLLQRADVAMYAAKGAHGGYETYAPETDHYSPRRLALVSELRAAIDDDGLAVHYQPKADLRTGRITGVEALLRWHHHEHGMVSPDEFVPIAEQTGLIRPLTLHVMRTAMEQCRAWQATGWSLTMAVNLSTRSLLDANLPDDVARLLEETSMAPECLVLEITESSMMADPARTVSVLGRLSSMGVALAVDDYGTGYSSLSYLKRLPVDEVKIDRSFVMNMATDENDAVIVRSTIDLGHNLGLRVVAEGVEDGETWYRLVALGCDLAQGYHLCRPVPAEELARRYAAGLEVEEQQRPAREMGV